MPQLNGAIDMSAILRPMDMGFGKSTEKSDEIPVRRTRKLYNKDARVRSLHACSVLKSVYKAGVGANIGIIHKMPAHGST